MRAVSSPDESCDFTEYSPLLKADVSGNELEGPVTLVILGGLATRTLRNLFLRPGLTARFGRTYGSAADA